MEDFWSSLRNDRQRAKPSGSMELGSVFSFWDHLLEVWREKKLVLDKINKLLTVIQGPDRETKDLKEGEKKKSPQNSRTMSKRRFNEEENPEPWKKRYLECPLCSAKIPFSDNHLLTNKVHQHLGN